MTEFSTNVAFQMFSIIAFPICFGFMIYFFKDEPIKATWFGFGAWIAAGLCIALDMHAWFLAHKKEDCTDPFSIEEDSQMYMDRKGFGSPRFFVLPRDGCCLPDRRRCVFYHRKFAAPPALISEFEYQTKINDGQWITLVDVPTYYKFAFMFQDGPQKSKILYATENGLDTKMRDYTIPSHGVIRGWAYYVIPEDFYMPSGIHKFNLKLELKMPVKLSFPSGFSRR